MRERNELRNCFTDADIITAVNSTENLVQAARMLTEESGREVKNNNVHGWLRTILDKPVEEPEVQGPKILIFDIETAPVVINAWSLWDNFTPLNMLVEDWFVLSWAAKWLGAPESEVMYDDIEDIVDTRNDTKILGQIWELLDEADVVITQNGIKFDSKKLAARFLIQGFGKPSPYKHIDTLKIAKREFAFLSNKLEYMTDLLCVKYKKLKHGKFAGFELWKECLAGNPEAWAEMKKYNMYDVLSLEELYMIFRGWDAKHPNLALFNDGEESTCNTCGSEDLKKYGFAYTNLSKFQRYKCGGCGRYQRGRKTLLTKEKRQSLNMNIM